MPVLDNLHNDSDDADSGLNTKVKIKRTGVFGKLKDRIFGHKKKRTRSHDAVGSKADEESFSDSHEGSYKAMSSNELTEDTERRLGNA